MKISRRYRIFSSFSFLNQTQFLGALNDNIFKLVIAFMVIELWGEAESNLVMVTSGVAYVLPFLLFSLPAGSLADYFSKRNITVVTKVLEVIAMGLGILAFYFRSPFGAYSVLFLMAFQSAIFGPSKYGIIPELVRRDQIARANGILTGLTVLSAIVGTFLAAFLTTITDRNFVFIGCFTLLIAIVGLVASLFIEKTPALKMHRGPKELLTSVYRVLKRARTENYLFASLIGSALFFLAGAYIQLAAITFAIQSLGLQDVQGGYLFLVCAFGISIGAYISGRISGTKVELGVSPLSGLGVSLFFILLWVFQHNVVAVVTCLFILGIFGGIYLVPFDAYIQAASPDHERGENVAAGNFLSFVGIAGATAILYFTGNILELTAAQGLALMGLCGIIVTLGQAYRLRDTFVRLAARANFHHGHHIEVSGLNLLSHRVPSVITCIVEHWRLGLFSLVSLQVRYMRFLIERPQELTPKERWLVWIGKVCLYDGEAPTSEALAKGRRWVNRGYSVTLIPAPAPSHAKREALKAAAAQMSQDTETRTVHATVTKTSEEHLLHLTPDVSIELDANG